MKKIILTVVMLASFGWQAWAQTPRPGTEYASLGVYAIYIADSYYDNDGRYQASTIDGRLQLNQIQTTGWLAAPNFIVQDFTNPLYFWMSSMNSGYLVFTYQDVITQRFTMRTFRVRWYDSARLNGTISEVGGYGYGFLRRTE